MDHIGPRQGEAIFGCQATTWLCAVPWWLLVARRVVPKTPGAVRWRCASTWASCEWCQEIPAIFMAQSTYPQLTPNVTPFPPEILLMEEILHQLIGSLSHYLHGFVHLRWCRISSINSKASIRPC